MRAAARVVGRRRGWLSSALHRRTGLRAYNASADADRMIEGQPSASLHRCFPQSKKIEGECVTA